MLKNEINRLEKLAKLHDWNNSTDIALRELAECAMAIAKAVEAIAGQVQDLEERHMT